MFEVAKVQGSGREGSSVDENSESTVCPTVPSTVCIPDENSESTVCPTVPSTVCIPDENFESTVCILV